MCGIAGYSLSTPINTAYQLEQLSQAIAHRGPDDEGFVLINKTYKKFQSYASPRSPILLKNTLPEYSKSIDFHHHIGLSHVRYSIIDLSINGHQPMWSQCQSVCVTFNGEIYNYLELRKELENVGYKFYTKSDTEVLIAGYLYWKEKVFSKLNGFFAIAIYDKEKNATLLARDRIGKAHLYYLIKNNNYYWASEIKSLLTLKLIDRSIVRSDAIYEFIVYGKRDTSGTFWQEIKDFPPAHYVWLTDNEAFTPIRYWNMPTTRYSAQDINRNEASIHLKNLLLNTLELRMRADVNIGFELSGGLDSSALVGIACGIMGKSINAFTVKFDDNSADEESYANLVSQHYPQHINYNVIYPKNNNFWDSANNFIYLQEEPFHSPNLHTNQLLRNHLKEQNIHVVLTGAASDELLGGYAGDYNGVFLKYLLEQKKYNNFFYELTHNNELSTRKGLTKLFISQLSEQTIDLLVKNLSPAKKILKNILPTRPAKNDSFINTFDQRTHANMTYRLMNYWLRSSFKSDYGIPIEARAPFLDYRIVEYCMQLPPEYLIHKGWQKHILRLSIEDLLPASVTWRKIKMGFPFPYKRWLLENKNIIHEKTNKVDCPFIDVKSLEIQYDYLVEKNPTLLWRTISTLLWWKRFIEQKNL